MNTFDTYLETVKKLHPTSVAHYRYYLSHWQTWLEQEGLRAEKIEYAHLLLFMQACQEKGYQKSYLNSHLQAIRHYFDYLISEQRLDYNPAANLFIRGIKRSIPAGLLERQALDDLYAAYCRDGAQGLRNKVLLGLLVFQALRTGELLQLQTSHVQLSKGLIEIPGNFRTEARTLKLEAGQMLPLQSYLSGLATGQPLFTDAGKVSQLHNRLAVLMGDLRVMNPGVKNASQLRQSVIAEWLKIKDTRYVQHWAGHRYVSSTERYQTHQLAALQADLNRFHPLQ